MTDLPPGWASVRLEEVSLPVEKIDPKKLGRSKFRYVDIGSVNGERQLIAEVETLAVEDAPSRARQLIKFGDTVFSTVRPYLKKIGYVSEALDGEIASTGFCVLRPKSCLDSRYLFHLSYSDYFLSQILPRQRGVSYPAVRSSDVLDVEIPLPPLAEQRRIVTSLEGYLSRIEVGASLAEKAARRSLCFRSALLNQAAQGLLLCSEDDLDAVDPIAMLEGRASKRVSYERLPPLPGGWKWRVAAEVCSSIECGSTPRSDLMSEGSGDVPFIKVYNLTHAGSLDFSVRPTFIDRRTHDGPLKRSKAYPGDVLTNIVGPPLGKTSVVPDTYPEWNMNQAVVLFRAGLEVLPAWLAMMLQSDFVMRRLEATARATAGQFNVALSACRELPIPVPPVGEQKWMLSRISELLSVVDVAESAISSIAVRSASLRKTLLEQAFSGKLVSQEAGDEPAIVLLARIKAAQVIGPRPKRARRTAPEESADTSRTKWPTDGPILIDYEQEVLL